MEKSFGEFLKQRRLEKKLTQKELAKLLFVTESAVSKWEKNISHPDITLLPKLSEILEVTEHELITASIDKINRNEKKQAKKWRAFSFTWSLFFYISYSVALLTCFICDLAINKTLSWFWIVLCSLFLAFTITNLPKLIKKHKLIILPLSIFLSLNLLLGVCCIYSNGSWFLLACLSTFLAFVIVFTPIYISKYKIFHKIKKYNDFVSIAIDFIVLNILLIAINIKTTSSGWWYFSVALPITLIIYAMLNLLLCVRFLKINKLLKTSIILLLVNLLMYLPPLVFKVKNSFVQTEILDAANILKADFSIWKENITLKNNIHCIIFLILLMISIVFLIFGIKKQIKSIKNKKSL